MTKNTMIKLALATLGGAAMLTAAPVVSFAAVDAPVFDQPPASVPNFTGKWINATPEAALKTVQGTAPPLNAAGRKEYARRQAALKAGDKKIDPISDCLMHGMPRLLYTRYPLLILQTGKQVAFVHEANHTFRSIWFNDPLPEEPDTLWLGYSTAKWEGRTLVINSIGFNDQTWLDYAGLPHGSKLKLEERYVLADANTIKGEITITDPDFYTKPWKSTFNFKKQAGMEIAENVCTDVNKM